MVAKGCRSSNSRRCRRRSEMRYRSGFARALRRAVLVGVGVVGLAVGACQGNGGGLLGSAGGAVGPTCTPKSIDAVMGVPAAGVTTVIATHLTPDADAHRVRGPLRVERTPSRRVQRRGSR